MVEWQAAQGSWVCEHDLCEDEVNSEDEYEENTDQWTWGYFVVGVMSMGKFMLLVFVELDTFGWK